MVFIDLLQTSPLLYTGGIWFYPVGAKGDVLPLGVDLKYVENDPFDDDTLSLPAFYPANR